MATVTPEEADTGDNDAFLTKARHFRQKAHGYRTAHFSASDHLRQLNYGIGFLLILVSAVVSGSVLQATHGNPSTDLTLVAGILAIVVTVLTSIQTTFKLGERGEQHRRAADSFGRVDRKLDILMGRKHNDIDKAWAELGKLAEEISQIEAGAPGYMRWTYERSTSKKHSHHQRRHRE